MKAAFPSYIEAVTAIQTAGVTLKGNVIIAGVVGEIARGDPDRRLMPTMFTFPRRHALNCTTPLPV
jgi:hypothetical protein